MKLYSFFRSSAAYRVRIALGLKELSYEYRPVDLLLNEGEQHSAAYSKLNPQKLVPTLVDGSTVLSQSLAIIEYLEEAYPDTYRLLPSSANARAQARELALLIGCEIHPLNNLRVMKRLSDHMSVSREHRREWYAHWIQTGFDSFEEMIAPIASDFCLGDQAGLVDCFLIPQVFNALSFRVDISRYKNIARIYEYCQTIPAFIQASPAEQPDAK